MCMTRQEYIHHFTEVAQLAAKGTTLFPSLIMAQAILESADVKGVPGNSTLARVYNNHFGIKADKNWNGKKVNLITCEIFEGTSVILGDYFRVYEHVNESFTDHTTFLTCNDRYAKAGVFVAKTAQEQAEALQRAKYSTNANYATLLCNLMVRLNLFELDENR